jgi:hypothetical protein
MSKLSLSLYLNAYDDSRPSNTPSRNPIKWARDLQSVIVNNPKSEDYTIDPGTTQILFNSVRTLLQDLTTQYSLALTPGATNSYTLSWTGGTAPNFRTPRTTGANATTQVTTSLNGTVLTFTSIPGTYASFTGQIAGMTTPVTITANTLGTIGNSVVLTADGTSSINTLISNWNIANPSNTITLTTGDGTQIPAAGTYASYTGTPLGASTPVTITANNVGTIGNSVVLTGNGTLSISTLIANWNIANPSNQITLTLGVGTQVPSSGVNIDLSGGVSPDTISLAGGSIATQFGLTGGGVVVGDYVTIGSEFNIANQGTYQIISMTNTTFSVVNASGVDEGPILLGSSFATQVAIFSAAGVQPGDTLVISAGFSPVSWGSYDITAVYAESLTFSTTAVLPTEGPITTEVEIYSMAKQLIYMESDGPLSVTLNGSATPITIEPFTITNCPTGLPSAAVGNVTPGMLMLKSTIYSISVTNNGITPVNLFLAAVE